MKLGFMRRSTPGGESGGVAGVPVRHRSGKALGALGAATAVIATAVAVVSVVPSAQATVAQGYAIAVQDSTGHLKTLGPDGIFGTGTGGATMAPGTSPSISANAKPVFGYMASYRTADGQLRIYDGSILSAPLTTIAAGTSPSTALKSTNLGPVQTFSQSASGVLQRNDNFGSPNSLGFQVAPNSSPAAASNSSGSMTKVAVVGTNGFLRQSTNGSAFSSEGVNVLVAAGTSPAAAAGISDAMVAVNSAGGDLLLNRWSDRTANDTGLAIKAGTSPAMAALSGGGFETAFVGLDSTLWLADGNGNGHSTGLKVTANSNPSIAADTNGLWRIAFNSADNGALATFDNTLGIQHTLVALAAGTSPSIAFVTPLVNTPPTTPPATTTPPHSAIFELLKQNPGVGTFIPYVAKYPSFGSVPPFHLIGMQFPLFGFVDQQVFLVKPGHSTEECGDPNAVIQLVEGQSLTAAQITTLYGSAQPHFSTLGPLAAVACWNGNGSFPSFVDLNITIQND
jgi:hypothetical protein